MLKQIFSFAALASLHTVIVGGVAHVLSGHSSPFETGAISFGGGMLGITFGAFAGHYIRDQHNPNNNSQGAVVLGFSGYAIGSAAGYFIR